MKGLNIYLYHDDSFLNALDLPIYNKKVNIARNVKNNNKKRNIIVSGGKMKTNINIIQEAIDYIENHLEETLNLDSLSSEMNYSKYHLSRIFVNIVGFTIHNYIQRRRLTEAARVLIFTNKKIMEVALSAGYETQQSFTIAFKTLFKCSPKVFRKKQKFYPIQLKFIVDGKEKLRGDKIMDIRTVDSNKIILLGYKKTTRFGFFVIGKCWQSLHANKQFIQCRKDMDFLIGLNDYTKWSLIYEKQPAFDYFSAVEVDKIVSVPKGMEVKELPASKYIVFSFRAKCEDSLQPVADYIYKKWFPQSSCQLNENARYDFAKYGESVDSDGKSLIEYWVPII